MCLTCTQTLNMFLKYNTPTPSAPVERLYLYAGVMYCNGSVSSTFYSRYMQYVILNSVQFVFLRFSDCYCESGRIWAHDSVSLYAK